MRLLLAQPEGVVWMKEVRFGVALTRVQRIVIADLFLQFVDRLKLDVNHQAKIEFTVSEMKAILSCAGEAVPNGVDLRVFGPRVGGRNNWQLRRDSA